MLDGFAGQTAAFQGVPEVEVAPRELWPQTHALAEVTHGQRMFTQIEVADATLDVGPVVTRIKVEGFVQLLDRPLVLSVACVGGGQEIMIAGSTRTQSGR